jgi:hypothetical protein
VTLVLPWCPLVVPRGSGPIQKIRPRGSGPRSDSRPPNTAKRTASARIRYHRLVNLQIRDLPDDVHATLVARAAAQGMSLPAYVVEVLAVHAALPTTEEWLAGLDSQPAATVDA